MNQRAKGRAPIQPQFPEYGLGGDYVGARRARRSFRFAVAAFLSLTLLLWFAEGYLTYDRNETQYRMALLHHPDSARAILRNVVKRDSASGNPPVVKYIEALADIEEPDRIQERYEAAYRLNPDNTWLILKFGCYYFHQGRYREARERFREAGIRPPKNALPRYLEAAALAAATPPGDDIGEALALVASTNTGGDPILFPQPLWHASLPRSGAWYVRQQRRLVDIACGPIYAFKDLALARARAAVMKGEIQNWDMRLQQLQTMGERLVESGPEDDAPPGIPQTIAGLILQRDAIELRKQIAVRNAGAPPPALIERTVKIDAALERIRHFESSRESRIAAHEALVIQPLRLCASAAALLAAAYAIAFLCARWTYAGRSTWAVAHHRYALAGLWAGAALQFLILCWLMLLNSGGPAPLLAWAGAAETLWNIVLAGLLLFGLVYPAIALPPARSVAARAASPEEQAALLPAARESRRIAYMTLLRRYYGILLGMAICAMAAWALVHRVHTSFYPIQVKLLAGALEDEEAALVRDIRAESRP